MDLHHAILEVLIRSRVPLTLSEIAFQINQAGLYQRKDGKPLKSNQILARIKKYPERFISINGYVVHSDELKWRDLLSTFSTLNSYLRDQLTTSDNEFIISSLFFYKRLIDVNSYPSKIYLTKRLNSYLGQDFYLFRTNYIQDWFNELMQVQSTHFSQFNFATDLLNLIKRLDEKTILHLLETIREFDTRPFNQEEYGKAFEYIIEISDLSNSRTNLVRTPREIIELMTKILNPSSGRLLDPVCGTGGFLTEANRFSSDLDLLGIEINYRIATIAEMNLIVNGREEGGVKIGNCFNVKLDNSSFDYIIGDLPIGGGLLGDDHLYIMDQWGINFPTKSKSFGAFLLYALSKLSYSGKAVFTISDSFLYRKGTDQKIRNLLLNQDAIETIISLPNGSLKPYTKGKASIIVLNKNKTDRLINHIQFIDLSNENVYHDIGLQEIVGMYQKQTNDKHSQIVSLQEISEFKTLNPKYFTQNLAFLRDLLVSGNGKYLGEIVRIQSGRRILERELSYVGVGIPYIRIENLEREVLDMHLSKENVRGYLEESHAYNKSLVIDQECILIAKIGENLKPTIFKPTDEFRKIVLHQNVIALFPKYKVGLSLEFLYYQLYSDIVQNQIENRKPASIVPFLTITSIKEILIPFTDYESQEKYIGVQKASIISAERSRIDERLKRLGVVEEAEERELDVVRTITHQLRHKLVDLNTVIEKAKRIMKVRVIGELKEYDDSDPILIPEDGFETPENEDLETILRKSEEKSLFLSALLTDVEKAINLDLKFEKFDLLSFIKGITSEYKFDAITIEVLGENVEVEFSESHFKDLIDTLIQNAKQHSFKKESKGQKIIFKVKPDFKRNLVVLEYSNNGDPLEITQKEYVSILTKSKSSNGSGIGGYYINKIIQAHGGLLKISENLEKGIKMKIEIPIEQNKELNE